METGRIADLGPELTDWAQTAAALTRLDLVISVDTAVAHLAGALGVPVWICLAALPEHRWMLDGSETHWYESARLFRQPISGDWESVFAAVARALAKVRAGAMVSDLIVA
jgi:ADP-heptose:LPS heptosyltransferase